ncbi:MAG: hypothetical protein VYE15_06480, partial [Myxococcota bacterium]|nr:hypothetical protein [Myxococcota bacterium]
TFAAPMDDSETIERVARDLLEHSTEAGTRPVRLLGVSVSGLVDPQAPRQLKLPLQSPEVSS